jgi:hypothetical protein
MPKGGKQVSSALRNALIIHGNHAKAVDLANNSTLKYECKKIKWRIFRTTDPAMMPRNRGKT